MSRTVEIDTHNVRLTFGKHKGELLTRVPIGYVRWMLNQSGLPEEWQTLAKAEHERRGGELPTLELSGHAIDNASLRCRAIWHQTATDPEEGLYAWLMRVANEAIKQGEKAESDSVYFYIGIKFVFQEGEEFPTLKTVIPTKKRKVIEL